MHCGFFTFHLALATYLGIYHYLFRETFLLRKLKLTQVFRKSD